MLALDLGGTKLATALFTEEGQALRKDIVPLQQRSGREVGALICAQINALLEAAEDGGYLPQAIGVSVPGIYYAASGRVWAPNIPGWQEYPLLEEISSLPATSRLVVTIDSDRAAYILGETWQGAAKGCRNAIFLAVGTGIGAGILVDGHLLRGHGDVAGAIGWLALDRPYRPEYKACGCFEYYASGAGIACLARELLAREPDYRGPLRAKPAEQLTAPDVFAAFAQGDGLAIRVLDQCIAFWGMAVANLVSLFNPEQIIFGGGVFGPAVQFLERIAEEARLWAQPISITQVRLVASALGGEAGLYGAARLAWLAAGKKTW
ncbi:MAG: ROK family protein [bacterium]|nr:ROK family protein [candidate division KSB1 bacterium]MDH7559144.1 ROK family protein [bacterium]